MSSTAIIMGLGAVNRSNYTVGLSASLDTISGQSSSWSQRNVDITSYAGATVRPVFYYVSGSNFTGDIQLDQIAIDSTTYSFESNTL